MIYPVDSVIHLSVTVDLSQVPDFHLSVRSGDLGTRTICAVPKSQFNMEVIVGTYEQVLVGFDVRFGEDEHEVACELVKFDLNFSLLIA